MQKRVFINLLAKNPTAQNVLRNTKRIFPNFKTELALAIAILSILGFSIGMNITATIGQEMTIMNYKQPEPTEVIEEVQPTQTVEFEININETEPVETVQIVEYQPSQMCFIGDSRMVGIERAVKDTGAHFVAKGSMGLAWFNDTASVEFEKMKDDAEAEACDICERVVRSEKD